MRLRMRSKLVNGKGRRHLQGQEHAAAGGIPRAPDTGSRQNTRSCWWRTTLTRHRQPAAHKQQQMAVPQGSPAPHAPPPPGPITHLVVQTAAGRVHQEHSHARPPLLQVAAHPRYRAAGACPAHKRVHMAARLLPNLLACRAGGRRHGSVCNSLGKAASSAAVGWSAAGARQQPGCSQLRAVCPSCHTHRKPSSQAVRPPVFRCARKLATVSNWSANTAFGCSAARRRATLTKWSGWEMDTGRSRCTSAPSACGCAGEVGILLHGSCYRQHACTCHALHSACKPRPLRPAACMPMLICTRLAPPCCCHSPPPPAPPAASVPFLLPHHPAWL